MRIFIEAQVWKRTVKRITCPVFVTEQKSYGFWHVALGSSILLPSLCCKEPGKKGWRRNDFSSAGDPYTNYPELLCENAGAKR